MSKFKVGDRVLLERGNVSIFRPHEPLFGVIKEIEDPQGWIEVCWDRDEFSHWCGSWQLALEESLK